MVASQRSLATAASHLDRRQTSHKAGLVGLNGEAGAAEDGDPAGSKQPRPVGDCPKWWQRADKRNVVIFEAMCFASDDIDWGEGFRWGENGQRCPSGNSG